MNRFQSTCFEKVKGNVRGDLFRSACVEALERTASQHPTGHTSMRVYIKGRLSAIFRLREEEQVSEIQASKPPSLSSVVRGSLARPLRVAPAQEAGNLELFVIKP